MQGLAIFFWICVVFVALVAGSIMFAVGWAVHPESTSAGMSTNAVVTVTNYVTVTKHVTVTNQ